MSNSIKNSDAANSPLTTKQLMNPRFKVIAEYPPNVFSVGTVLECPEFDYEFIKEMWVKSYERYPNLYRRMNWWEERTVEQMPKRVLSMADDSGDVFDIEEWDMNILVGWVDKKRRRCCSLLIFNPEYGYFPID